MPSLVQESIEGIKAKVYKSMTLIRRAKNDEGLWLHLNGLGFTSDINERWLGTVEQFEAINEIHGGTLTPVHDDRKGVRNKLANNW